MIQPPTSWSKAGPAEYAAPVSVQNQVLGPRWCHRDSLPHLAVVDRRS